MNELDAGDSNYLQTLLSMPILTHRFGSDGQEGCDGVGHSRLEESQDGRATGFGGTVLLDHITGGLKPGQLLTLGKPGYQSGKSNFMGMMVQKLIQAGINVTHYSIEGATHYPAKTEEQLVVEALCC